MLTIFMADFTKVLEICPYVDRECSENCIAFSVNKAELKVVCQRLENETISMQSLEKISMNTWYR